MNFVTITFVLFLVLCFSTYWCLPSRAWQNRLLLLASYTFYGWWDARFCGLLFLSSLVDFLVARAIGTSSSVSKRKLLLWLSVGFNLGILGVFKYYNFFQESLTTALTSAGFQVSPWTLNIILPVGISFYTFQSMSYTIDVYRGHLKHTRHLDEYLTFVAFFPQLVAGPVERASHLLPQFQVPRNFDWELARDGCRQILWGFAKKMIIADNVAAHVNATFAHPEEVKGVALALAAVLFAFQIYCDFSAYSDIAIGCARLFGFDICANFRYPYFSQSPAEFWRRWHISLSSWFRDYVYIPLGGGRSGRALQIRNVVVTFLLSGLWHGA